MLTMKFLQKSICFVAMVCLIAACGGTGGGSAAPVALNLTGFEQIDLGGGAVKAIKKNAAGKIIEEGILISGKKNGTWMTYFEDKDDRIKTMASYVNDNLNGQFLTFSNRGQIETQTSYVNGQYDGVYTKYRFGNVEETAIYRNGIMEGTFKQFYNNNKIKLEAQYQNGKQHGSYKYYDEEGNVMMEYEYANGEKVSGGLK